MGFVQQSPAGMLNCPSALPLFWQNAGLAVVHTDADTGLLMAVQS